MSIIADDVTMNQKMKVPTNDHGRKLSSIPISCVTDTSGLSARYGAGHPATFRGSQLSWIEPSVPYIALSSVGG